MVTKKIENIKAIKPVSKTGIICSKCFAEMIITGGGPLGSIDYECPKCHAKMTKGG